MAAQQKVSICGPLVSNSHIEFNTNLIYAGNIASPNFPDYYPYNLEKTQSIKVGEGEILLLEFTDFDVFALTTVVEESQVIATSEAINVDPCPYDYVQVIDNDGTMLMNKSCGYMKVDQSDPNFYVPPNITSNTNMVDVFFRTDGNGAKTGWSLNWRAVASGKSLKAIVTNSWTFPFSRMHHRGGH